MGKVLSSPAVSSADGLVNPTRSFQQAALSARFIGVAALTLGAVALYAGRQASVGANRQVGLAYIIFSLMFIVPGLLYLTLAGFVARQRRWAVVTTFLLAMVDMTLLGILFVTSFGAPGAIIMCVLSGLFVVALGVMSMFLGRSLESLKRLDRR